MDAAFRRRPNSAIASPSNPLGAMVRMLLPQASAGKTLSSAFPDFRMPRCRRPPWFVPDKTPCKRRCRHERRRGNRRDKTGLHLRRALRNRPAWFSHTPFSPQATKSGTSRKGGMFRGTTLLARQNARLCALYGAHPGGLLHSPACLPGDLLCLRNKRSCSRRTVLSGKRCCRYSSRSWTHSCCPGQFQGLARSATGIITDFSAFVNAVLPLHLDFTAIRIDFEDPGFAAGFPNPPKIRSPAGQRKRLP